MSQSVAKTSYERPLILLHWLMALMVFGLYAVGLSIDTCPKSDRPAIVNVHAIVGLALLTLVIPRLLWRLTHATPAYRAGMSPLLRQAAAAGHALLYLLMIAAPAIGVPTFLWRGVPLNFGLFQIASPFEADRDAAHWFAALHELFAHVLIALVAVHALAALYHQFVLRDGVLNRMKA
jgi:cytochrome b561